MTRSSPSPWVRPFLLTGELPRGVNAAKASGSGSKGISKALRFLMTSSSSMGGMLMFVQNREKMLFLSLAQLE